MIFEPRENLLCSDSGENHALQKTAVDYRSLIREAFMRRGIAPASADIMLASITESTLEAIPIRAESIA